ncbi:type II toxin-antitoxin system HicA family toxin [Bacteroides sp. OttesenSCG-928-D19]|nr:type II toxin-antitoxin system HicA family toxin [Bacteroides sp. OttesenSCG-928-D19]
MSYKTVKEVIILLEENGFDFKSQKGSHMKYVKGDIVVIVPNHGRKGIEKGTYYNILRQAGIKKL